MTQHEAVADWWRDADEPTRRRALRLAEDDLLPEDRQRDLAMAGVTVVPLGRSVGAEELRAGPDCHCAVRTGRGGRRGRSTAPA